MFFEDASTIIKLTDSEFNFIVQLVSQRYGIDLSQKRRLIEARLASELKAQGYTSYSQYINLLKNDPHSDKIDTFINKITTNYSYFFREMDHYDFLASTVVPALVATKKNSIKIWSAGCSTGEEPYNIAMALDSALGMNRGMWNISVTATDVSTRALTVAKAGIYPESELNSMPPAWKNNYMEKLPDGNFKVIDRIRKLVSFSKFNLMDPFPQKNFYDVIFCRNVMIYFKAKTTEALIQKFYQSNTEGGYLFIGHSESISRLDSEYTYIRPAIFRKIKK
ncbi:MAG: protein-glutamate O-methyltransferase CheR [Oscillospiraceae bacterium]